MTEDAEDKHVTNLSYESKPARAKEREIASGVHILTSDNPASCVWARLSWHGRNGNYGDLRLVPPVATIISHGLCVFFFFFQGKAAEWLFIILWNEKRPRFDLDQLYIYLSTRSGFVCTLALCWHDKGGFLTLDRVLECLPNTHMCMCWRIMCAFAYRVCVFTFAGWGVGSEGGGRARRWVGGRVGVWTSSPRKLSVLQKPELQPVKTMRGTRETLAHGG